MDPCVLFSHVIQGCSTGPWLMVRLPQGQSVLFFTVWTDVNWQNTESKDINPLKIFQTFHLRKNITVKGWLPLFVCVNWLTHPEYRLRCRWNDSPVIVYVWIRWMGPTNGPDNFICRWLGKSNNLDLWMSKLPTIARGLAHLAHQPRYQWLIRNFDWASLKRLFIYHQRTREYQLQNYTL